MMYNAQPAYGQWVQVPVQPVPVYYAPPMVYTPAQRSAPLYPGSRSQTSDPRASRSSQPKTPVNQDKPQRTPTVLRKAPKKPVVPPVIPPVIPAVIPVEKHHNASRSPTSPRAPPTKSARATPAPMRGSSSMSAWAAPRQAAPPPPQEPDWVPAARAGVWAPPTPVPRASPAPHGWSNTPAPAWYAPPAHAAPPAWPRTPAPAPPPTWPRTPAPAPPRVSPGPPQDSPPFVPVYSPDEPDTPPDLASYQPLPPPAHSPFVKPGVIPVVRPPALHPALDPKRQARGYAFDLRHAPPRRLIDAAGREDMVTGSTIRTARLFSRDFPWSTTLTLDAGTVRVRDVWQAVHETLRMPLCDADWGMIFVTDRARAQAVLRVARERHAREEPDPDSPLIILRVDTLLDKTVFAGIEQDDDFVTERMMAGENGYGPYKPDALWLVKLDRRGDHRKPASSSRPVYERRP